LWENASGSNMEMPERDLEDLGSKNGSFLRGRAVEGVAPLADGDEIRLGSVPFTVRVFADPGSTASRSRTRSGGEAKRDRR
jgi:pSer/pThr/pTyr-binding forkhead associated (FHA) protein